MDATDSTFCFEFPTLRQIDLGIAEIARRLQKQPLTRSEFAEYAIAYALYQLKETCPDNALDDLWAIVDEGVCIDTHVEASDSTVVK